jgi:subtilase family serine protease
VIAGLGLVSATLVAGANVASASPSGGPTTPVRANRLADTAVPRGATDLGRLAAASPVSFDVVLAPSNPAGEAAEVEAEYSASSPLYHHWLTPSQFDTQFGPSAATVTATEAWLQGKGLRAQRSSEFALSVSAPADQVAQGLGLSFETYRFNGHTGYAPRSAPVVPQGVLSQVEGLLGLNTMKLPAHHESGPGEPGALRSGAVRAAATAHASGYTGTTCPTASIAASDQSAETMLTEGQTSGVSSLWSSGLLGQGQTVAVYELAGYQPSDTQAFESCFGLTNPVRAVGDAPLDLTGGGTSEADLDIEQVAQQAPDSSIVVYQAPNSSDDSVPYNLYAQIVHGDTASTVTSSWGDCEPDDNAGGDSYEVSVNSLMEQAALQGQSVFAAAGDAGSEDCATDYVYDPSTTSPWSTVAVDFPGASPWVTSVGGTQFANETENYYQSNTGVVSLTPTQANLYPWNFCFDPSTPSESGANSACETQGGGYGAGGGGASSFETAPSWQQSYWSKVGYSPVQGCGSVCREVPDVTGNAGYPMLDYGPDPNNNDSSDFNSGFGTSYAAPFLAGEVADRNSGCLTSTGNFGALVYGLAGAPAGYSDALVDVDQGNNDMLDTYNGSKYAATKGYDMATGLGQPIPAGIACPEVTSITQNGSPTSRATAGTTVVLHGIGLEDASIYFGPALATVTSATATSATVTVPQVSSSGAATTAYVYGALNGQSGNESTPLTVTGTAAKPTCAAATGSSLEGAVGVAAVTINGCPGYFVTDAEGRVAAFGSATTHGDRSQFLPASPIVGIAATPSGEGYYLYGAGGAVFAYGDAKFEGSAAPYHPSQIVGMALKPDNSGYWLVAAAGGVFAFNAPFEGSMGGHNLPYPMTGMGSTPAGSGYWLVSDEGGIYSFNAPFFGSLGNDPPAHPIVGMTSPLSGGYTLVDRWGTVYPFETRSYTSTSPSPYIVGISAAAADNAYYLVGSGGGIFAYGPAAAPTGRV